MREFFFLLAGNCRNVERVDAQCWRWSDDGITGISSCVFISVVDSNWDMFTLLLNCDRLYGCSSDRRVLCVFQPYVHYSLCLFVSYCLHCCSAVTCCATAAQVCLCMCVCVCACVCMHIYFNHMWDRSQVSVDIVICVCHLKLPALSATELNACITTETMTTLWHIVRGQRPPLAEITSMKVQGGCQKAF